MDEKRKELNSLINRMYRQLGKQVYNDLEKDHLSISSYKKLVDKIRSNINAIHLLDITLDHESEDEALDDLSYGDESLIPVMNDDGVYEYRFCPACQAGNHPDAIYCIRCKVKM
ncbi:zinc ribbon domain-containing protein [Petrocella sp. FN5]|uniref:zinc ribbon domain-containing protein n=1 Tax=Petrocella sp. FN5 TaxID=3032002 RepID=UPI0023DAF6A8|nr:zinc ribbon domain-containing protein [Petrocella sp. FN5]MDF1618550.1 zinc ribbon domain-containing protein [Petrocella sp. FN5]